MRQSYGDYRNKSTMRVGNLLTIGQQCYLLSANAAHGHARILGAFESIDIATKGFPYEVGARAVLDLCNKIDLFK
ncbi:MAG TPA: hypothetical protein V6C81_23530 [Planktothrix sp.]